MTTDKRGLYVHIPFCVKKCDYCDFCSYTNLDKEKREGYIETLIREIYSYKREPKIKLDTVFLGGGTPSLLSKDEISRIFEAINLSFEISVSSEITIEANPKTLTREKLECYINLGINRLSLGLQSIHENELKMLGRIHTYSDFLESFSLARECGFNNINVDLMYAIPEQTKASFDKTLSALIALSPEHISVYGLIIEEGTPFYERRKELRLPTEDEECDMYELAFEKLKSAGYLHYEISNYAKENFESRHNLHYWLDEEYIGVGVNAYSYFENKRFSNPDKIDGYFIKNGFNRDDVSELSAADSAYEYAMLALRLARGLSLSEYESRFNKSFLHGREALVDKYVSQGYMNFSDGRISLTERGFYVSNTILSELL